MTTTNPDTALIKVDCIGRIRTTPKHREALLAAFERSAMGGPEFCSHHGIKYQTFATWLQKHRRATGAYPSISAARQRPPLLALSFAEVEIPEASSLPCPPVESVQIRLPGGASLHFASSCQLPLIASLLRELNSPRPC